MAQFKVYRNERRSQAEVPFLVDVQSDLVQTGSRLVIPLVRAERYGLRYSRLSPTFTIDGLGVVAAVSDLAAIDERTLRAEVADLSTERYVLLGAIDFLMTGH